MFFLSTSPASCPRSLFFIKFIYFWLVCAIYPSNFFLRPWNVCSGSFSANRSASAFLRASFCSMVSRCLTDDCDPAFLCAKRALSSSSIVCSGSFIGAGFLSFLRFFLANRSTIGASFSSSIISLCLTDDCYSAFIFS